MRCRHTHRTPKCRLPIPDYFEASLFSTALRPLPSDLTASLTLVFEAPVLHPHTSLHGPDRRQPWRDPAWCLTPRVPLTNQRRGMWSGSPICFQAGRGRGHQEGEGAPSRPPTLNRRGYRLRAPVRRSTVIVHSRAASADDWRCPATGVIRRRTTRLQSRSFLRKPTVRGRAALAIGTLELRMLPSVL